jgi:hypothetical protein|tara:strand:- start:590 stop:823 length:234 start_codon:yes stop_codon:yes gene_type:complete
MIDWEIVYWTIIVVGSLPFLAMAVDLFRVILLLQKSIILTDSYFRQLYELDHIDNESLRKANDLDIKRKAIADKYSC